MIKLDLLKLQQSIMRLIIEESIWKSRLTLAFRPGKQKRPQTVRA